MIILNKVVGIGIVVVVIAVIIGAVMSFSNDSGTTTNDGGFSTGLSTNEYSEEESVNVTDHSIILYEKIGVKTP